MKTKYAVQALVFGMLMLISTVTFTYSGGPPEGKTNAPGETVCTDCHSDFSLNSDASVDDITFSSNMPGGNNYVPGETYTITLGFHKTGVSRIGFEAGVVSTSAASTDPTIGTLIATDAVRTQVISGGAGANRSYIEHTSSGYTPTAGANSWSFDWEAPTDDEGPIKFYVAINAANGDGGTSGDRIYAKAFDVTPLPVTWLTVAASYLNDGTAEIRWATATEINNSHFEVEKSADAAHWEMIGKVNGQGNSSVKNAYSFIDERKDRSGVYYRIKQVDYDGKYDYSSVVKIKGINIYPSPADSRLNILGLGQDKLTIKIMNLMGQEMMGMDNQDQGGTSSQLNTADLPKGIYLLVATDENGKSQTIKFYKN